MSQSKVRQKMLEAHDALESGVYLVEMFEKGKFRQHGIFTTSALATAWMESFPECDCVCAPFVLDEPAYGNVVKEDQH